jgi:transposase
MAVVADKGMNTAQNAYYIANGRGWYIFSQTVRGGTKELKSYVLNESGYEWNGTDFKMKSRQFTRHVKIERTDGTAPIEADISEKQVVFYSRDYDVKAKQERAKVIAKAHAIINNPSDYNKYNVYGAAKYIRHLEYGDDGEIVSTKSIIKFDEQRLLEDEKFDGYYLVVSNCFDKSANWIVEKYRGLWEIEETFKVTKSDLEARPVYVSRRDHIEAHFLICFIALVIIRLLQKELGGKYSSTRILESLSRACCFNIDTNRYMAYYFDEVLKYIEETTSCDFSTKFRTLLDIRKMIGATKK